MRVVGSVLIAWERGLWIRSDGAFLRAKATVRPGEATLTYTEIKPASWRARLAMRLLGL